MKTKRYQVAQRFACAILNDEYNKLSKKDENLLDVFLNNLDKGQKSFEFGINTPYTTTRKQGECNISFEVCNCVLVDVIYQPANRAIH